MPEEYEWDLTEDETIQLQQRFRLRQGRDELLASLARLIGEERTAEGAWWESVRRNHNIPSKYFYQLRASHECRKVWVSDKVKRLDNLFLRESPQDSTVL